MRRYSPTASGSFEYRPRSETRVASLPHSATYLDVSRPASVDPTVLEIFRECSGVPASYQKMAGRYSGPGTGAQADPHKYEIVRDSDGDHHTVYQP
jgi:hypothetical protein